MGGGGLAPAGRLAAPPTSERTAATAAATTARARCDLLTIHLLRKEMREAGGSFTAVTSGEWKRELRNGIF